MKKLILAILVMLMPMLASADPVEIDGLFYNLTKKAKIAEVTYSPDASDDITIPEQVTYVCNRGTVLLLHILYL